MRRNPLGALAWATLLAAGPGAAQPACNAPPAFLDLAREALEAKRSVTFYLQGQSVPVVVTGIVDECTVEGRNREFERVLIRLDRIAGLART